MSGPVFVSCACCLGTGRMPLGRALAVTLGVLTDAGPMTTVDLLDELHRGGSRVTHSALCNRLVALERLGLVSRGQTDGERGYDWRAVVEMAGK